MSDIYQTMTDTVVEALEKGVKPWVPDWTGAGSDRILRPLRHGGEAYQGGNHIWLAMAAMAKGYTSPYWMTFNQAKAYGGTVRKGEKATPVLYAGARDKDGKEGSDDQEATGDDGKGGKTFFTKSYSVFNACQIDGLDARFFPKSDTVKEVLDPKTVDPKVMKALEEMTAGLKLQGGYAEQGTQAFYSPTDDRIVMPPRDTFRTFAGYSATRIHEMAHATETTSRLDHGQIRLQPGQNRFGSTAYAVLETRAELTALMAGAHLGYVGEHIENSTNYIGGWFGKAVGGKESPNEALIREMKADKTLFYRIAAQAGKASDYLLEHTQEYNKEKRAERDALPADMVKDYTPREGGVKAAAKRAADARQASKTATKTADTKRARYNAAR
jgi:antirestriction protein ArdC